MQFAYRAEAGKLVKLAHDERWIRRSGSIFTSPCQPRLRQVAALGVDVPTLADMEEIEISNRLYREPGADYITVVLPGQTETKEQTAGPVCFILTPKRLITVRHHAPRPFETFPGRSDKGGTGCDTPEKLFLGLMEEIVGRLADLLEGAGRGLEEAYRAVL